MIIKIDTMETETIKKTGIFIKSKFPSFQSLVIVSVSVEALSIIRTNQQKAKPISKLFFVFHFLPNNQFLYIFLFHDS